MPKYVHEDEVTKILDSMSAIVSRIDDLETEFKTGMRKIKRSLEDIPVEIGDIEKEFIIERDEE